MHETPCAIKVTDGQLGDFYVPGPGSHPRRRFCSAPGGCPPDGKHVGAVLAAAWTRVYGARLIHVTYNNFMKHLTIYTFRRIVLLDFRVMYCVYPDENLLSVTRR